MIPATLSTFDRVVATTTKPDMVRATALARGRAAIREDRRGLAAAYRSPDPLPDPAGRSTHSSMTGGHSSISWRNSAGSTASLEPSRIWILPSGMSQADELRGMLAV
jgi:hypothetical protein